MSKLSPNNWFSITASADKRSCDVAIMGYVGDSEAGLDAKGFETAWAKAVSDGMEEATIRINSNGGSVVVGLGIYNTIKHSEVKTRGIVLGVAASMASIILMACDYRQGYNSSKVMIHQPSGVAMGGSKEMRDTAAVMDGFSNTMKEIYMETTGADAATVDGWMADGKDTWFNAYEAYQAGILTGVIRMPYKAYDGSLENIESVIAHYAGQIPDCGADDDNTKTEDDNKMKDLLKKLGLPEGASEAQAIDAVEQLRGAVASARAAQVETVLAIAKADGRITAANEAQFKALLNGDFDTAKAVIDTLPKAVTQTTSAPNTDRLADLIGNLPNSAMGGGALDEAEKLVAQYDKLDKAGQLLDLKAKDKDTFAKLYEAKYGIPYKD